MPAPGSRLAGTRTVPLVAVSGTLYATPKKVPVAGSMRPGYETTSVGVAVADRPARFYRTGISGPLVTAGARGAATLGVVPSHGPNVSVNVADASISRPRLAVYVRVTLRGDADSSGCPAEARMADGRSRAQGVRASTWPPGPASV